jgi:hypothetical protein
MNNQLNDHERKKKKKEMNERGIRPCVNPCETKSRIETAAAGLDARTRCRSGSNGLTEALNWFATPAGFQMAN